MTLTRYDNLFYSIFDRIQQAQISQGSSHFSFSSRQTISYLHITIFSSSLDRKIYDISFHSNRARQKSRMIMNRIRLTECMLLTKQKQQVFPPVSEFCFPRLRSFLFSVLSLSLSRCASLICFHLSR